jgi:hypothetical protein
MELAIVALEWLESVEKKEPDCPAFGGISPHLAD